MPTFRELYNSSNPTDRRQAVQMLQGNADPRATEALRQLALHDAEAGIRLLARQALAARGEALPLNDDAPSMNVIDDQPKRNVPPKPSADVFLLNPDNHEFVDGHAARPVKFGASATGSGCMMLFMIPFMLAGLFVVGFAASEWSTWFNLRTNGVQVSGTVVAKEINSSSDNTSYDVTFTYTHNGRSYEVVRSVDEGTYNAYALEQPIPVVYTPNNPAQSRPASQVFGVPWMPIILTGFGLVWNLFIWPLSIGLYEQAQKARKLDQGGQAVRGELRNRRLQEGEDDFTLYTEYEFTSPTSGTTLKGKSNHVRNDLGKDKALLEDIPPGTAVLVWYLDDKTHDMV
jgi:hypothetical protein